MYVILNMHSFFSNHLSSTSYRLHTSRLQRMLADSIFFTGPTYLESTGAPSPQARFGWTWVWSWRSPPLQATWAEWSGCVGCCRAPCGAHTDHGTERRRGEGRGGRDRGVGSGHGLINHLFHTVGKVICVGEHVKHDSVWCTLHVPSTYAYV